MDQNLSSDRPSHGQIQTLDKDYHFEVDEWTKFGNFDHGPSTSWTDSEDGPLNVLKFRRRWTDGQMDENPSI